MIDSIISKGAMTTSQFFMCLGTALLLGLGCMLLARFKNRFTRSIALALAILPAVVMLMIMLVNDNLGMGLAVGGTFALVRFRSIRGSARDIALIFLACALGVACGQGYLVLALLFFAVIAVVLLALSAMKLGGRECMKSLKVTVPENMDYEGVFDGILKKYTKDFALVRVKSCGMGTLYELEYELDMSDELPKAMLDELRSLNGNLKVAVGPAETQDNM